MSYGRPMGSICEELEYKLKATYARDGLFYLLEKTLSITVDQMTFTFCRDLRVKHREMADFDVTKKCDVSCIKFGDIQSCRKLVPCKRGVIA